LISASFFFPPFPLWHTPVAWLQPVETLDVEEDNESPLMLVFDLSKLCGPVDVFGVLGVLDELYGELGSGKRMLVLLAQLTAVTSATAASVEITISTHCNFFIS